MESSKLKNRIFKALYTEKNGYIISFFKLLALNPKNSLEIKYVLNPDRT